jgi:hypothetical protein
MQVNKHHTSDCTDFVLVYYDHRHSRIDETNILIVVKAIEGETGTVRYTPAKSIVRNNNGTPLGYNQLA